MMKNQSENLNVLGIDLLKILAVEGVTFYRGDVREIQTVNFIKSFFSERVDTILSDMAPNTTGHQETDKIRSISLTEKVLDFCTSNLKKDGNCLVKVFQGAGFDSVAANFKKNFAKTSIKKPQASKSTSKEVYIFATGFKG